MTEVMELIRTTEQQYWNLGALGTPCSELVESHRAHRGSVLKKQKNKLTLVAEQWDR